MAGLPLIFDISSDEESEKDNIGGLEVLRWTEPKSNDEDWLLELLEVADNQADDSDEVVVVAEFNPTKKISKSKSSKTTLKDSDDDCVILAGDPDNSVATVNDSAEGSDEILIVGEKGQIACRDYPHPRHLCAIFPFISTPHQKHCDMCHCYVCDTIAPCLFWGGGFSLVDHCHATDKELIWKEQRKSFKKENRASLPVALPQINLSLQDGAIRLVKNSSPGSCFLQTNQTSQSTELEHCSSNSIAASTIDNHRAHQQSALPENRFQLRQASHYPLGLDNSSIPRAIRKVTQRDKGNSFSQSPCKFVTSNMMFKRTGVAQFNRFSSYRNNSTDTSKYVMNPPFVAPCLPSELGFGDRSGWHDSLLSMVAGSYSENVAGSACTSQVEIIGCSIAPITGCHQHQNQTENSDWSSVQPENPIQNASQNIYQQENPNQICQQEINTSFQDGNQVEDSADAAPDVRFDWSSDHSLNNPPSRSGACQVILSEPSHSRLAVEESGPDVTGNFPSVPPTQDWLYGFNILSPPPSSINANMILFDFETSWNGITEV